ncbi:MULTISPECIES: hypothetical protein [Dyella]|uniref:hypothetical protein n=1 Tax=Dyella TaxID=231454 RepID=UPI0013F16434|nr:MULTISPECIES: hypothetical protein [Dyella]
MALSFLASERLAIHMHDRVERVMSLLQQMNNVRDYDSDWSTCMHGQGVFADLICKRFE